MEVNGYKLDDEQLKCIYSNSKYLQVNAGAGSGKSLTIIGKVNYLIENKNYKEDEILCISFTNESVKSLEKKLRYKVKVRTFHKLALDIIGDVEIASSSLIDEIINEVLDINNKITKYLKTKYRRDEILYTVKTFILLFSANDYNEEMFEKFFINNFSYKRHQYLKLIYYIYKRYLKELNDNDLVDFDLLIKRAINYVNSGYKSRYKYIIIDEFQDTSLLRLNLVKSLIDNNDSNLMVVGDDFQSIYGFSGCDIDIFLNLNKYFKDLKVLKLSNTYRNSQELIKVAGNFVMKNDKQLRKNLVSSKNLENPIKIIKGDIFNSLVKIIELYDDLLILGRNNYDLGRIVKNNAKIRDSYLIYKDKSIKYLTVHKAKGLEASNVVIINLDNKINGFPNKIVNDKIVKHVSKKSRMMYEEERRLFYVALTRSKNYVYLLVNDFNSYFVKELIKDYNSDIEIIRYK